MRITSKPIHRPAASGWVNSGAVVYLCVAMPGVHLLPLHSLKPMHRAEGRALNQCSSILLAGQKTFPIHLISKQTGNKLLLETWTFSAHFSNV